MITNTQVVWTEPIAIGRLRTRSGQAANILLRKDARCGHCAFREGFEGRGKCVQPTLAMEKDRMDRLPWSLNYASCISAYSEI